MSTRLDIAIGVAQALTYLHLYADRPIIHRDIKSSHILLTDTYRAKVVGFKFSCIGPSTEAGEVMEAEVRGTAGECLRFASLQAIGLLKLHERGFDGLEH